MLPKEMQTTRFRQEGNQALAEGSAGCPCPSSWGVSHAAANWNELVFYFPPKQSSMLWHVNVFPWLGIHISYGSSRLHCARYHVLAFPRVIRAPLRTLSFSGFSLVIPGLHCTHYHFPWVIRAPLRTLSFSGFSLGHQGSTAHVNIFLLVLVLCIC